MDLRGQMSLRTSNEGVPGTPPEESHRSGRGKADSIPGQSFQNLLLRLLDRSGFGMVVAPPAGGSSGPFDPPDVTAFPHFEDPVPVTPDMAFFHHFDHDAHLVIVVRHM